MILARISGAGSIGNPFWHLTLDLSRSGMIAQDGRRPALRHKAGSTESIRLGIGGPKLTRCLFSRKVSPEQIAPELEVIVRRL